MANFSQEVITLAQQSEAKWGVPASVTLAQYALESGYGKSGLATKGNNYFGITGKNHNNGKYIMMNGRSWAKYDSMAESFDDHGRLLADPLYANSHKNTKDPSAFIDAIAEIYAPSSDGNNEYATLLKQIIAENDLTQYDAVGIGADGPLTGNVIYSGAHSSYSAPAMVTDDGVSTAAGVSGKIVKFLALVAIGVMAAVFFFSAFDFSVKKIASKKIKKVVGDSGGES